jgi:uncharacterized FlaG/YvyC family protein
MDISATRPNPIGMIREIESSRQMSERMAVEVKTNIEEVKPQQPKSTESSERSNSNDMSRGYRTVVNWYQDEEGEIRAKIKNDQGEVVRYIPPETINRIMKDLLNPTIDTYA